MKGSTQLAAGLLFLTGVLAVTAVTFAGQLEPPGPVAPTDRLTLNGQQVAPPHTITEPGSYVLTSDIRDCLPCDDAPTDGIIIDASDVTLDLNGFAIVGAPGNSLSGVVVQAGRSNVVITNGVVRDWDDDGIDAESAPGARIEQVRVSNNGGDGIVVSGGGIVRSCTASDNGGQGIVAGPASVITHCTATGNGADGIVAIPTAVPRGSTISHCGSSGNGGAGIIAGDGTTITDCAVSVNGSHGISTGLGCTIRGNTTTTNAGDGIQAFESLVIGNTSTFNTGANINATDSTVIDNHVSP